MYSGPEEKMQMNVSFLGFQFLFSLFWEHEDRQQVVFSYLKLDSRFRLKPSGIWNEENSFDSGLLLFVLSDCEMWWKAHFTSY